MIIIINIITDLENMEIIIMIPIINEVEEMDINQKETTRIIKIIKISKTLKEMIIIIIKKKKRDLGHLKKRKISQIKIILM